MSDSLKFLLILDANVWVKERLLRSAIGAALLHLLSRLDVRIGLPDVTRAETINGIVKLGLKAASDVDNALSTIQSITGSKPSLKVPSDADLHASAEQRLRQISRYVQPIDHSIEQMERALRRVVAGTPPNVRKEQYRDSLLWEVVFESAAKYEVLFVSNDGDFTDHGKPGGEFATELQRELREKGRVVRLFPDLAELLVVLEPKAPPFDVSKVAGLIVSALDNELYKLELKHGMAIGNVRWKRLNAFVTEEVDILAVKFRLNFPSFLPEPGEVPRDPNGAVLAVGECFYNTQTVQVTRVTLDRIQVIDSRGETKSSAYIYLSGTVGGEQTVPYTLRRPVHLPQEDESAPR